MEYIYGSAEVIGLFMAALMDLDPAASAGHWGLHPRFVLPLRLYTIPIEDLLYNITLLGFELLVYEGFKRLGDETGRLQAFLDHDRGHTALLFRSSDYSTLSALCNLQP